MRVSETTEVSASQHLDALHACLDVQVITRDGKYCVSPHIIPKAEIASPLSFAAQLLKSVSRAADANPRRDIGLWTDKLFLSLLTFCSLPRAQMGAEPKNEKGEQNIKKAADGHRVGKFARHLDTFFYFLNDP